MWFASPAGKALKEIISNRSARAASPVMRTLVSRLNIASTVAQSSTPWMVEFPERNSVPLLIPHGLSCGINSGTEFLSGNSTIQGVELCATVEAMLSLETSVRITGDAALADRLEMISFNALPAGLANHIKGLQYYALPNNVAVVHGAHGFNQDYQNGTLPGPNSGYPCCRCNFHM